MVNTLTQEEFGEESVYSSTIPRSHSTIEVNHFRAGTQAETWRQEMKERPCRNAAYCLASSDLFSYQAYLPKDGTIDSGMDPPISIKHQGNTNPQDMPVG